MTIDEAILKNLDVFIDDVKTRHKNAGQYTTGKTINSLAKKKVNDSNFVVTGASYIGVLETGRKGGKIPKDFVNILRAWAIAKGITFKDEKEANRWLNYHAWHISRFGTKTYYTGKKVDIFTTPLEELKKNLTKDIGLTTAFEIKNKIFENGNNSTT